MDIDITPINNRDVNVADYIGFVTRELTKHIKHISLDKNSEYKKIAFASSNQNSFKCFFEEIVPLMFFLQIEDHNYQSIKYMAGDQKGDAILDDKTTIEITKAQHDRKDLVTQDLLNHGVAFSPKNTQKNGTGSSPTKTKPYVRTNKEHVDDVADYILRAINRKKENNYPNNSILIISFHSDTLLLECDGDYSHLEQKVANYEKGIFSNIYIVEDHIIENLQPKWQYLL